MESLQTAVAGSVAALAKCEHSDCICTVSTGERFCSDYCMEQAGASEALDGRHLHLRASECLHSAEKITLPPAALPA